MTATDHRLRNYIEFRLEHYKSDAAYLAMRRDEKAENVALLRALRCVKAIRDTLDAADDIDRELVRLVYWERSHTIAGAGLRVYLSKSEAYRRIDKIITKIAEKLGEI